MTISSIECEKKYNISPSIIRFNLQNTFYLGDYIKSTLEKLFIKEVPIRLYLANFNDGTYTYEGITYDIIYYRTDPVRIKRAALYRRNKVMLSFRLPYEDTTVEPIVLVKLIKENNHDDR